MTPSPRSFLIWGGGGHGKVVADLVRACGHRVAGFIDADSAKMGQQVEPGGSRVVTWQEEFLDRVSEYGAYPEGIDAVTMAIGDNAVRQDLLRMLQEYSVPFLVHPFSAVSPSAAVGRGTVVFAAAVINAEARIGEAVIINSAAVIEHDCLIADGAHISPGAALAGGVHIGERSWVGAGATVIHGVRIGTDAMVGAGAVVIRDVPDRTTVAGVPARPVRSRIRSESGSGCG